jgi:hypothetical protein
MTGSKEAGGMSADGDIQNNIGQGNTGATEGERNRDSEARPGEAGGDQPDHDAAKEKSRRAPKPAAGPEGVLPKKAAEDDPRRWGDQPDNYDHDAWLQEQKPPHWG